MKRKGVAVLEYLIAAVLIVAVGLAIILTAYHFISKGHIFGEDTIDDAGGLIDKYALCKDECHSNKLDPSYTKKHTDTCADYYVAHPEDCEP
ncbi:MAG: hypothetical protein KAJ47_01595 [Candidatus Aenigmarchaeota archaeon]|nr:hypothetical protein [Candidatus Aenigmarchaeota archaeon]